eukprot:5748586-Amphidinium_carterae.1
MAAEVPSLACHERPQWKRLRAFVGSEQRGLQGDDEGAASDIPRGADCGSHLCRLRGPQLIQLA